MRVGVRIATLAELASHRVVAQLGSAFDWGSRRAAPRSNGSRAQGIASTEVTTSPVEACVAATIGLMLV